MIECPRCLSEFHDESLVRCMFCGQRLPSGQAAKKPWMPGGVDGQGEGGLAADSSDAESSGPHSRANEIPFCGRWEELRQLRGALEEGFRGEGPRVIRVLGEAGIGKTRLCAEALKLTLPPVEAIRWEGSPVHAGVLCYPVMRWLRNWLGISDGQSASAIRAAIASRLTKPSGDTAVDPLLIQYLFGLPEAISAFQGTPPAAIRQNVFGAVREILLQSQGNASRVLVANDLQWFDPWTLELLQTLMNWPDSVGGLVFILIERSSDVERDTNGSKDELVVRLEALSDSDRSSLLRELTPLDQFMPEVRRLILDRSHGNPLFIEEVTRLVQRSMHNGANFNGEALSDNIVDVIPISLYDLIEMRISDLDSRHREVLQCVSVLGMEFSLSLIEMFDGIRDGLAEHLHALRTQRLLEEHSGKGESRFVFAHGLYQNVAYSMMTEGQKQRLHLQLARALEQEIGRGVQEHVESLAFHYQRGGEADKAIRYLVKSAERQFRLGASAKASGTYAEAFEILRDLPATEARQTLMARVLIRSARLHRAAGDLDEAREMLDAALDCAKVLHNEWIDLEARLEQAISFLWQGNGEEAEQELHQVAEDAARLNNSNARLVALNALGVKQLQNGCYEEALQSFQQLAELAEISHAPQVEADAFNNSGLIYWRWGQREQALKAFRRALPLRRKAADTFGSCATQMNIGILHEEMGRAKAARMKYKEAQETARRTGYVQAQSAIESNLSNLCRRTGNAHEALEHAHQAIYWAERAGDPVLLSQAHCNAGQALLARWEFGLAREQLIRARALAAEAKASEAELDADLSLLELAVEETPGELDLEKIDGLLALAQEEFIVFLPRVFRLKAKALRARQAGDPAAKEYLLSACHYASDCSNFFEELESWRARRWLADQDGDVAEHAFCAEKLAQMEALLSG